MGFFLGNQTILCVRNESSFRFGYENFQAVEGDDKA
jgi:hypothetical protein